MVQAPRYKPELRGFDSLWRHKNLSLTSGLTVDMGSILLLTLMSTKEISWYVEGGEGVKAAGA